MKFIKDISTFSIYFIVVAVCFTVGASTVFFLISLMWKHIFPWIWNLL
jgi:hypothetical protein